MIRSPACSPASAAGLPGSTPATVLSTKYASAQLRDRDGTIRQFRRGVARRGGQLDFHLERFSSTFQPERDLGPGPLVKFVGQPHRVGHRLAVDRLQQIAGLNSRLGRGRIGLNGGNRAHLHDQAELLHGTLGHGDLHLLRIFRLGLFPAGFLRAGDGHGQIFIGVGDQEILKLAVTCRSAGRRFARCDRRAGTGPWRWPPRIPERREARSFR